MRKEKEAVNILQSQHEEELKRLAEEHLTKEKLLNEQLQTYKTNIFNLKHDRSQELHEMQAKYVEESRSLKTEIVKLKNKHEESMKQLTNEHNKQLETMGKDRLHIEDKFSSDIESLRSKLTLNHNTMIEEMQIGFEKQKEMAVAKAVANTTAEVKIKSIWSIRTCYKQKRKPCKTSLRT